MSFVFITSTENKIIKHTKKLNLKSYRDKTGEFFAEGKRLVEEALLYSNKSISYIIVTDDFLAFNAEIKKMLDDLKCNVYTVPEKVFTFISDTKTPQGILVVLKKPLETHIDEQTEGNILVLDCITEPGNAGTIIRTAHSFGFNTIVLTKGCVDVFSPKVVRAAMGAVFKVKFIFAEAADDIKTLKENGFCIVSAALKDAVDVNDVRFGKKTALVIGNEANGISQDILDISDMKVKIPISDSSESLNAAVAAGILMYTIACACQ